MLSTDDMEQGMLRYMQQLQSGGQSWMLAARHMLGLWNGTPGARRWRQVWSNHRLKALPAADVAALAHSARLGGVPVPA